MANNASKKEEKSRYFTFILYPDSLPDNWWIPLEELGFPMAISPLHDKDKYKGDDKIMEYKKEHYHVIYVANNSVTPSSVRKKLKRALGDKAINMVKICDNVENMYLYLTHESKSAIEKKKHVYDKNDIIHLNNFDLSRYLKDSLEDKQDRLDLVLDIIFDEDLKNMKQLVEFINKNGEKYKLNRRLLNEAVKMSPSLVNLYLNGNYQEMVIREAKKQKEIKKHI